MGVFDSRGRSDGVTTRESFPFDELRDAEEVMELPGFEQVEAEALERLADAGVRHADRIRGTSAPVEMPRINLEGQNRLDVVGAKDGADRSFEETRLQGSRKRRVWQH